MEILTKIRKILFEPEKFFTDLKKENGIKPAFIYLAIISALGMILSLIPLFSALYFFSALFLSPIYLAVIILALYILGLLFSFIIAGFIHIGIKLFGGNGTYIQTYQLYVYSITPMLIFSLIYALPLYLSGYNNSLALFADLFIIFLGILAFAYTLILLVIGTQKIHLMERNRAVIAYVLLLIVAFVIYLLISALFVAAAYLWMMGIFSSTQYQTQEVLNQTTQPNSELPIQAISIPPDTKDCSGDLDCFQEAMAACKTATMASPWLIPKFFPCSYSYTCDRNQLCWHYYTCDLMFKGIDQFSDASNVTYRVFEFGNSNNCTLEIFKEESETTEAKIMTCSAPIYVFLDENFKYRTKDYCSGIALQGISSSLLKSKENSMLLNKIFQDVETVMLMRPNDTIQIREEIPYDFIANVSFDDVLSEYEYKWSDGVTFNRLGPLPIEGGAYDLTVRKEVIGKRMDEDIFVYRVISADKAGPNTPDSNITIPSAYQCGSDICFEIKALYTNSLVADMDYSQYWIHDTLVKVSPWWGPDSQYNPRLSCETTWFLVPGESCFGKISNFNCTDGTLIEVYLRNGAHASKTIEGCNSTDTF